MSRKRSLGWFSKGILFLNAIVILVLLVCYLAPFISPQTFWPIALVGIAYPFLLIVNIIFIAYWLYRKPTLSVFSVFFLLLGWSTFSKTIGLASKRDNTVKDTASVRVMSYNVHLFRGVDESVNTKNDILDIFKEVAPDIICIQEFYTRKKGTNDIQTSLIKKLGFRYHYFQEVAENDFDAYGIAIFSKYPIVKSGSLDVNIKEKNVNRIQYADIKKDSTILRVYNVHLQSIGFQKEDYDFINNKMTNMDEDLSSTRRIGGRLKKAFIKRGKQVDLLYDHIGECETPYIVVGDFNDTPSSYAVNRLSAVTNNAFASKGTGWGITYNGAFPNFQIDYILASKGISIENFHIISEKISDHYPIWSDLKF